MESETIIEPTIEPVELRSPPSSSFAIPQSGPNLRDLHFVKVSENTSIEQRPLVLASDTAQSYSNGPTVFSNSTFVEAPRSQSAVEYRTSYLTSPIHGAQLAVQPSSAFMPVSRSATIPIRSATQHSVVTEVTRGSVIQSDRYGHPSQVKVQPSARVVTEQLDYDVPTYIISAEEPKQYLDLPFKQTELALDQQIITRTKRMLSLKDNQRWIFTENGYIESCVNRMVVLAVHKPATFANEELLVTAVNKEMIQDHHAVRWSVEPAKGPQGTATNMYYIALASDPNYVLDIQKVGKSIDFKKGSNRLVVRRNAGFSDNRQKWLVKLKYYYTNGRK